MRVMYILFFPINACIFIYMYIKLHLCSSNLKFPPSEKYSKIISMSIQEAHNMITSTIPPNFDLQEYMATKANTVNIALELAIPLQNRTKINESMRHSLLHDEKRIRAVLCMAACELVGGDEALAMPIACAVEMIHTMSLLIHNGFREATTLLASGSLLSLAFKHVAVESRNDNPQRVVRVVAELASAVGSKGLVAGELADLRSEAKEEVGLEELEYIHVHKTSKLFEAAVVCGAILGGGDGVAVERLRKYGRYIGQLYEVVDDILDVVKTSEELEKKMVAGKDLVSNTTTYPRVMGIENAKEFAVELSAKAMEELSHFDDLKAAPLYHFIDYVASRHS